MKGLLLGAVLSVVSIFAQAEQVQPTDTSIKQKILQASGLLPLNDQVRFTAQQIFAKQTIERNAQFTIAQKLAEKWQAVTWQQTLLKAIEQQSASQQKQILALLQRDAVVQFRQQQAKTIASQASDDFKQYQLKVRGRSPAVSRLQLVQEVDRLAKISEFIIAARADVHAEIQQQVEGWQVDPMWQQQAADQSQEFLLFMFRRTSNQGLQNLIDIYKSANMQSLLRQVKQSI